MSDCELTARVAAYHDGELDPSAAQQLESHLPACAACAEELRNLREMSGLFGALKPLRMEDQSLAQVHDVIDAEDSESGILRIGGLLAAMAASVVVIGGAWLAELPAAQGQRSAVVIVPEKGTWESVAVDFQANSLPLGLLDRPDRQMLADARTADWMIANLSEGVP